MNLSYDLDLWSGKWHNTFFVKEFINTVRIEEKTVGSGASHTSGYDSERSRTSKWFTCYGFGTRYKLHSILSAKLSYEYSVRLPGAMELLGDGDNINANYALEPEKVIIIMSIYMVTGIATAGSMCSTRLVCFIAMCTIS